MPNTNSNIPHIDSYKYCTKCNQTLWIGEFYQHPDTGYYQSWCRGCQNKYLKAYNKRNHTTRIKRDAARLYVKFQYDLEFWQFVQEHTAKLIRLDNKHG